MWTNLQQSRRLGSPNPSLVRVPSWPDFGMVRLAECRKSIQSSHLHIRKPGSIQVRVQGLGFRVLWRFTRLSGGFAGSRQGFRDLEFLVRVYVNPKVQKPFFWATWLLVKNCFGIEGSAESGTSLVWAMGQVHPTSISDPRPPKPKP